MKLAITARSAPFTVTAHGPVPEHAPDQPVNVDWASGVAVSVMLSPLTVGMPVAALQLVSHWMPAGVLDTVPLPAPVLLAVSW